MPAGYSARCRVCNSPRRAEIEEWIAQGLSPRAISAKLAELGEKISHVSIWQHRRDHFNVAEEAARRYAESRARLEAAAQKRVNEIETLDEQIAEAAELRARFAAWLRDLSEQRGRVPQAVVQAYAAAAGEVRQAAKTKAELLGDDPESRKAAAIESWLDLVMLAEGDAHGRDGGAGEAAAGAGPG